MAPLWDNDDDHDDNNLASDNDNDNHCVTSKDFSKDHPSASAHCSTDKHAKVMIDATVANQLLKELLVDPLSYADYDHTPPITQAQLDF